MFLQIYKIFSNFDPNPLICGPTLFFGKNSPNISKNSRAFSGKGRGYRLLILTYLDSPIAETFLHNCLSFSILAVFREKRVVKFGPKVQTLGPPLFYLKLESFKFFSNNVLGENFDNIGPYL